jgi:starvation-inducible DNA-binding protein
MTMIMDELKQVQATTFAFARKAQYYHWNIEGADFVQYHKYLGKLYTEVDSAVDALAELVRTMDGYAPGARRMIVDLSLISDDDTVPMALSMLQYLRVDNDTLLNALRVCYQTAEDAGQIGISNYLQDRIQAHEKHAWMLHSLTKP